MDHGSVGLVPRIYAVDDYTKLIQLLGKYDSAYQDIDACDHSLEAWKGKLKGMFFHLFPVSVAGVASN